MAWVQGIEPWLEVLETPVLPLYDTHINFEEVNFLNLYLFCKSINRKVINWKIIKNKELSCFGI